MRTDLMSVAVDNEPALVVNGVSVEMIERGTGRPILFLHPGIGIESDAPVLDHLARAGRVLAPSHPGFGNTPASRALATIDDLSYFYLDMMEALDLRDVLVVGVGLGGWIAAEIAVKDSSRLSRLVMANAVGVKVGDRETRDIVDIWSLSQEDFDQLAWADPAKGKRDYSKLPNELSLRAARAREATARLAWSPYMHNPRLRHRLHRVRIPTLFLWGMADRVLSETYGRGYCAMIPGARFEALENAGHFPHLEQPEAFAERTLAFAAEPTKQRA